MDLNKFVWALETNELTKNIIFKGFDLGREFSNHPFDCLDGLLILMSKCKEIAIEGLVIHTELSSINEL